MPKGENDESPTKMKRGYSMVQINSACRISGTSIHTNVLVKKNLPARGLVSSNPLRVERLVQKCVDNGIVSNLQIHSNPGWGLKVWTCSFSGFEIFIAISPMGSTGSGMCFWELYAAQAQAIIRLGANDQTDDPNLIVICNQADNLVNLPHSAGDLEVTRQTVFKASSVLVDLLKKQFAPGCVLLPVHHVEDFHAYNLSECLPDEGAHIISFIDRLKRKSPNGCCWDMESAALFYRAQQYGLHAATILIPMTPEGAEVEHYRMIFQSLVDFSPSAPVTQHNTVKNRATRKFSTNDVIGTDDTLFVNDPELGNNLFVDDSERGGEDLLGSDPGGIMF